MPCGDGSKERAQRRVEASMSHRINDVVHAKPNAEVGKLLRILWIVRPLPGISDIGIQ
jgi:hypothetical protein